MAWILALVALAGCGGTRCPEGTFRRGPDCVPLFGTDAGPRPDAGRRDAGRVPDAGERDAGPDAGVAADAGADAGACEPCPAERPACDGASGRCVECTADDRTLCGARACDLATSTCAPDVRLCERCTADAACGAGLACANEVDGDGGRCVWREETEAPGPAGSCLGNGRPFVERRAATSLDGAPVTVCVLARSTCAAWLLYGVTSCTSDEQCGLPSIDDGRCVDGDPGPREVLRCTLTCSSDNDCPSGRRCDRVAQTCAL